MSETKSFFILYKPKDIVSGDFYHALAHQHPGRKEELFYFCAADCTGHGVPGALMSMMGISRLNESIIEKNIVHPNEILDNMRRGIITSLNPEGREEESKDGMDCVLCAYDFQNMTMEFAAANNPLWHVRDQKLTEYKPDKMPVGMYGGEMKSFSLQKIDLKKGDIVYTFTDGFADQFGLSAEAWAKAEGEKTSFAKATEVKGKKYKYKQLQELLLSICEKPMDEQKLILNKSFEDWRGSLEQVDDVLVMGLRV
jgi:serine phosphatase RsbU (regulator of sigma subunit)